MLGTLAFKMVQLGQAQRHLEMMEGTLEKSKANRFIPPFPVCDVEQARYDRDKLERELVGLIGRLETATMMPGLLPSLLYSNKEYEEVENGKG